MEGAFCCPVPWTCLRLTRIYQHFYTTGNPKVAAQRSVCAAASMAKQFIVILFHGGRTKKKINCKNSYLANYCFPRYFCYRLDNYRWLENGRFHCWHWSDNKNVLLLFSWKNLEQDQMGYKKEMVVVILVFVQKLPSNIICKRMIR